MKGDEQKTLKLAVAFESFDCPQIFNSLSLFLISILKVFALTTFENRKFPSESVSICVPQESSVVSMVQTSLLKVLICIKN